MLSGLRRALLRTGAGACALFGICCVYLTWVQPLGPCLYSKAQLIALLLGMAARLRWVGLHGGIGDLHSNQSIQNPRA